jgi:beta-N-acetylhexosaminidase
MDPQPVEIDALAGSLKTEQHRLLSRELTVKSMTLLRDPQGLIPLNTDQVNIVLEDAARCDLTRRLGGATICAGDDASNVAEMFYSAPKRGAIIVPGHDFSDHPARVKIVQQLVDLDLPVIVLISRNPFEAVRLPDRVTVLIAYGLNPPVREALAEVLVGNIQPAGILPVEYPD